MIITKGKMINALKKIGVRTADKNGATVGLSHIKTPQITALYYQYCVKN